MRIGSPAALDETNVASAVLFESFERIGIAEELGHANEQLMEQGLELSHDPP